VLKLAVIKCRMQSVPTSPIFLYTVLNIPLHIDNEVDNKVEENQNKKEVEEELHIAAIIKSDKKRDEARSYVPQKHVWHLRTVRR
jgi:hypothetical protein